jgi:hypothetical protein
MTQIATWILGVRQGSVRPPADDHRRRRGERRRQRQEPQGGSREPIPRSRVKTPPVYIKTYYNQQVVLCVFKRMSLQQHQRQYCKSFVSLDQVSREVLLPLVLPHIPDLRRVIYTIYEYDPLLDSSNMTMDDWIQVCNQGDQTSL